MIQSLDINKLKFEPHPSWAERTLQGLAFWMGYKKQLYGNHPIPEAAIVTELLSLLYIDTDRNEELFSEVKYSDIITAYPEKRRADIVLKSKEAVSVIEVKRGYLSNQKLDKDFYKLASLHKSNPELRCFMVLACEQTRPSRFITEKGVAV